MSFASVHDSDSKVYETRMGAERVHEETSKEGSVGDGGEVLSSSGCKQMVISIGRA
jgi:hypothetical protein